MYFDVSETTEILLGSYKSCKVELSCLLCGLKEINHCILMALVDASETKNLLNIKDLCYFNTEKSCQECKNGVETRKIVFNNLVFINIQHTEDAYQPFEHLTLDQIALNFDHDGENYELKFLIDFECHNGGCNHFVCYSFIHGKFWRLDDVSQSEQIINNSNLQRVNPNLIVYFKSEQQLIEKAQKNAQRFPPKRRLTEESLDQPLQKHRKKKMKFLTFENNFVTVFANRNIRFVNMCAFNSIFHGMVSLFNTNDKLKDFFKINQNAFFKIFEKIIKSQNVSQRNKIWADFIGDSSEIRNDTVDKFIDISDAVQHLFGNFGLCVLETLCLCGVTRKIWPSVLYVVIDPKKPKDLLNIQDILKFPEPQKKCNICLTELSLERHIFNEFLFIATQVKASGPRVHLKVKFSNIAMTFKYNEEIYHFKFLIHHSSNHFICYSLCDGSIWMIDDLESTEKLIERPSNLEINPALLVYSKIN
jgi:hypothetical protein